MKLENFLQTIYLSNCYTLINVLKINSRILKTLSWNSDNLFNFTNDQVKLYKWHIHIMELLEAATCKIKEILEIEEPSGRKLFSLAFEVVILSRNVAFDSWSN